MTLPAGKRSGKQSSEGNLHPFLVMKAKKNGNDIASKIYTTKIEQQMKNAGTVNIILLLVGGFISFLSKTLSLAPKYSK